MWSTPAVWKQYNKIAVLRFFLVNSPLIYILFSLIKINEIFWSWEKIMWIIKTIKIECFYPPRTLMHLLLFTITIHLNKLCFVALHMCYINEGLCRFLRVLTTINYRNFLTIVNDLRELVSICTQRIRNCNEQLTFLACIAPRTG